MNKLDKFLQYHKKVTELEYMIGLLDWEIKTKVPSTSMEYAGKIKTKLEAKLFKMRISKKYMELIKSLIDSSEFSTLDDLEQRYIKKIYNKCIHDKKIPADLYKKYTIVVAESTKVWSKAKDKNDYEIFKPYLEELINLTKEMYKCRGYKGNLYDAMISEYEEGFTSGEIDKYFEEIKRAIIPIIKNRNIKKANNQTYEFNKEKLLECAKYLLEYIGFDFSRGCIDTFEHGFTTKIGPDDVRIAFNMSDTPESFVTTVIHEGGHGLLEQNISENLRKYGNMSFDNLFAFHESQSRFYENILGRNINFWIPIYDKVKNMLEIDAYMEEFFERLTTISAGPIRTEADEVTYCMHIIVRYEIERDIFNDRITIDDIPKIWNEKMEEYLGITPSCDNEGLMQDIHWSQGDFGYFPSYLLGTIFDGMLKDEIEREWGSIDEILKSGRVKDITSFLVNKIYKYGGAYNSKETIKRVCGKRITTKPIIKYFKNKYLT